MLIKARLTLGFAALLLLAVAVLVPVMLEALSDTVARAERRELGGYLAAVRATAGQRTNTALALAELVAGMPGVAEEMTDAQRVRLETMFAPSFAHLKRDAGVDQFQFHKPAAISFLRLHQPDRYGDDLTALRPMVVQVDQADLPVRGLEYGVAGLGARAVVPIDGASGLLGTVEFGMDFGQTFANDFKSRFGVDIAIALRDGDGFRTVAATSERRLGDDAARREAFAGAEVIRRDRSDPHPLTALIAAIDDYSGKPAAVVEIDMDAGEFVGQYRAARFRALTIGGLVLAAGLALAWFLAETLSRPLVAMTDAMLRLADGDLSVTVPAAGRADEIGRMAQAMFVFKRNRAEMERQKAQRDQFARLGVLGEMASNIAHELSQPLASILNYGRGMVRMLDGADPDLGLLRTGAVAVAEQAERAGTIIQRIRGYVRRRPVARTGVDLNAVVRETVALFRRQAGRGESVRFVETLADGLPQVEADRVGIEQVLLNLLQNAVEAMVAGGTITVTTRTEKGGVAVCVRDSGPGLTDEARRHLFDPFFTTKSDGLGLGLSICRTIVESHGGRLWAAPAPGGGLILCFALPQAVPA